MIKKKIAIICGYFPFQSGGAEYQAYLLAKELRKYYEVHFIFVANEEKELVHDGFHLHAMKKKVYFRRLGDCFFLHYRELLDILDAINPAIIYNRVATGLTGIIAMYGKKHQCKTSWHIASQLDVEPINVRIFSRHCIFDLINKYLQKQAVKHIDLIFTQAEYQDRLLSENFSRQSDLTIGNFHPIPDSVQLKSPKQRQILWVANAKPIKRPEIFSELARKFQNTDIQFVMVGRDTKEYCQKLMLPNLIGVGEISQDEVNTLMAKSCILVNTSIKEGFSNTFIQAWLHKLPVVSLSVNPDDILTKYKIGYHSQTFEQLCEDIQYLWEHPAECSAIGEKAFLYAVEHHSVKNIDKIISLLK